MYTPTYIVFTLKSENFLSIYARNNIKLLIDVFRKLQRYLLHIIKSISCLVTRTYKYIVYIPSFYLFNFILFKQSFTFYKISITIILENFKLRLNDKCGRSSVICK